MTVRGCGYIDAAVMRRIDWIRVAARSGRGKLHAGCTVRHSMFWRPHALADVAMQQAALIIASVRWQEAWARTTACNVKEGAVQGQESKLYFIPEHAAHAHVAEARVPAQYGCKTC